MTNNVNEGNVFAKVEDYKMKRFLLVQKSIKAKQVQRELKEKLAAQGGDYAVPRVNDILLQFYKEEAKATEFHSYAGWMKLSKKVRRGSKGFLIWSQPRVADEKIKDEKGNTEIAGEYKYWATAYVFSNRQIE
jgi:hypothetical protein